MYKFFIQKPIKNIVLGLITTIFFCLNNYYGKKSEKIFDFIKNNNKIPLA